MNGLDDGPDGLRCALLDGYGRRLSKSTIAHMRANAVSDDCVTTIVLCDIVLGRLPDEHDLARLPPEGAARMAWIGKREAMAELVARSAV